MPDTMMAVAAQRASGRRKRRHLLRARLAVFLPLGFFHGSGRFDELRDQPIAQVACRGVTVGQPDRSRLSQIAASAVAVALPSQQYQAATLSFAHRTDVIISEDYRALGDKQSGLELRCGTNTSAYRPHESAPRIR
jgi:hypothetical protein